MFMLECDKPGRGTISGRDNIVGRDIIVDGTIGKANFINEKLNVRATSDLGLRYTIQDVTQNMTYLGTRHILRE